MKTMSCDLCDKEFCAEKFDEWVEQMKSHYVKDHADFLKESQNKSKEGGMKWMTDMKEKFDSL